MLGVVFPPLVVHQQGLPEDLLELLDFQDETDLLLKPAAAYCHTRTSMRRLRALFAIVSFLTIGRSSP